MAKKEDKKVIVRRSFAKEVRETKVVDGKTVTEIKREDWSDQPEQTEFDWEAFDGAMDAMGKVLDSIDRQRIKKPK